MNKYEERLQRGRNKYGSKFDSSDRDTKPLEDVTVFVCTVPVHVEVTNGEITRVTVDDERLSDPTSIYNPPNYEERYVGKGDLHTWRGLDQTWPGWNFGW